MKTILKIRTGSFLYGTNVPTSDQDYQSIFFAPEKYVYGLSKIEEMDMSVHSKQENGKNDKDAVDDKGYEFRNFMKLASDNNPNILEILFANKENIIYIDSFGELLRANRHLFPFIGLEKKFRGYAHGQKHKMIIRTDNIHFIKNAIDYFESIKDKKESYLVEYKQKDLPFAVFKGNNVQIGDMNFLVSQSVHKTYNQLYERWEKSSHRKDGILEKGMDCKFALHLIRLLYEGLELLDTGEIVFPLKQAPLLLDIRNGKYDIHQILDMAEELENRYDNAIIKSKLPKNSMFSEVEELTIKMMKSFY